MNTCHPILKRTLAGAMTLALLLSCAVLPAAAAETDTFTLGIYSTTDMHGKCYHQNPITGKDVKDSYLKVATAMKAERKAMDGTILIDNGDVIQGSPIISYNMNMEGGKENPMALCLRYCGYDAFVPGNHEFNFNQDLQQIFYDMLADDTGKYAGAPVDAICANYIDVATQKSKLEPYKIMTFDVDGTEFKVGILGLENVNVPNWDLPSHYTGADFVHKDNTERTYVYEWTNYWQKELRETEKCDFVVASCHSGEDSGTVGAGAGESIETGKTEFSPENQVRHLVENTTGIDMVIAGHNHKVGVTTMVNASGQEVPCVNGGSSTLTKTVVTVSKDGTFSVGASQNLALADYENDAGLIELMTPYYDRTLPFVSEQIGTLSGDWDDVTALFHVQSDTMDLVHEAQLWATGADLSLASPVANKDFCIAQLLNGAKSGPISLKDCYSFYKYDNNLLYMIEMNGKQIKDWMEKCVQDYTVEADGAITGGGFGTDQLYGISYDVYLGNPIGQRVLNMTYQGQPVTDAQTFKVALNSYRLSANAAGDEYGWYATTGITMGSDKVLWDGSVSEQFGSIGGSVTLVAAEYIKSLTAAGKEITPPQARSTWTLNTGTSGSVTRLQFVEALYTAVGAVGADTGAPFVDLGGNAAVSWAAVNGVLNGDGQGRFLPNEAITREQAAVILYNYAQTLGITAPKQGISAAELMDYSDISQWALSGADFCYHAGVIAPTGQQDKIDLFSPKGTVSASEAATMFSALLALGTQA